MIKVAFEKKVFMDIEFGDNLHTFNCIKRYLATVFTYLIKKLGTSYFPHVT